MNKNIMYMSLEELREYREELVKHYIGEFTKPYWYFDKLTDIDVLINSKELRLPRNFKDLDYGTGDLD